MISDEHLGHRGAFHVKEQRQKGGVKVLLRFPDLDCFAHAQSQLTLILSYTVAS